MNKNNDIQETIVINIGQINRSFLWFPAIVSTTQTPSIIVITELSKCQRSKCLM